MPDIPEIPETPAVSTPDSTPGTPTEGTPAGPAAAVAPASRPEPSVGDTARLLAEHFPALFGAGVIKPIKLRIQVDIHQRAPGVFTKKALSIFLQRHTTGSAYLRALVAEGATRTDLDGQPVGEIAAEHRAAAVVELERRRAIVEARKRAGREATRGSRHETRSLQPPGPPPLSQPVEASAPASPAASGRPDARAARSGRPAASGRPDRSARPSQPGPALPRSRPSPPGAPRGPGRPGGTGSGAPRRPHEPQSERKLARAPEPKPANVPTVPPSPEQAAEAAARQQRALLLRSFEQSPLSKANFGALKGLSEADLDALLTLARQERGAR